MTWAKAIKLLIEIVALILRYRLDPERLNTELAAKVLEERERLRRDFREAIHDRNADTVSRMLRDARDKRVQ